MLPPIEDDGVTSKKMVFLIFIIVRILILLYFFLLCFNYFIVALVPVTLPYFKTQGTKFI
jgi:hypothetical protein